MTTTEPEAIHLAGDGGILSAIPAVLGFHPKDSLVVLTLQESRGRYRVGPLGRVDMKHVHDDPVGAFDQIARGLRRHADAFAVITYGATAGDAAGAAGLLDMGGAPVIATIDVGNEPALVDARLHAEVIGAGKVIEASRDDVAARIEYDPATTIDEVHRAFFRLLRDNKIRDKVLVDGIRKHRIALPDVIERCREMPDDGGEFGPAVAANLLAITGCIAYRGGDGALALAAIERAYRIEPGHRLATLLEAAIGCGLPPAELDSITGDPGDE